MAANDGQKPTRKHQPKKPMDPLRKIGVDASGLSALECRFVHAYLAGPPDLRGKALASAHWAGRSQKDGAAGTRLTSRPHVRAALAQHFVKLNVTTERVLAETAKLAFSDMRDYVAWGPDGVVLKGSEELPDEAAAAVAEVSEHRVNGEKTSSRQIRFKLHDKVAALTNLSKYLKLFVERVEHTGKDGGPIDARVVFYLPEPTRRVAVLETPASRALPPAGPEGNGDGLVMPSRGGQ